MKAELMTTQFNVLFQAERTLNFRSKLFSLIENSQVRRLTVVANFTNLATIFLLLGNLLTQSFVLSLTAATCVDDCCYVLWVFINCLFIQNLIDFYLFFFREFSLQVL